MSGWLAVVWHHWPRRRDRMLASCYSRAAHTKKTLRSKGLLCRLVHVAMGGAGHRCAYDAVSRIIYKEGDFVEHFHGCQLLARAASFPLMLSESFSLLSCFIILSCLSQITTIKSLPSLSCSVNVGFRCFVSAAFKKTQQGGLGVGTLQDLKEQRVGSMGWRSHYHPCRHNPHVSSCPSLQEKDHTSVRFARKHLNTSIT